MVKAIGIVNLHSDVDFVGLTERRPVASVSFLGRYALIDFVLSNMSNSTIDAVGVLIQKKPRSLFKHLGNGDSWNFNSKAGGVSLLYNEKYANNPNYNHDINNLIENIAFLEANKADYVVIAPAHIITTMDYEDVIENHEKTGAEITIVYKKVHDANEAYIGCDCLTIKDKVVTAVERNKGSRKDRSISLETYVINTKTLLKVMKQAQKISSFFSLKDVLGYLCDEKQINAYEYKGYARCIDSLEHYYKYSLEFLDLTSFDTTSLESLLRMFYDCNSLQRIYVSPKWKLQEGAGGMDVFTWCTSLPRYNAEQVDVEMASPINPTGDTTLYKIINSKRKAEGYLFLLK